MEYFRYNIVIIRFIISNIIKVIKFIQVIIIIFQGFIKVLIVILIVIDNLHYHLIYNFN